jgi:hypothetical protein
MSDKIDVEVSTNTDDAGNTTHQTVIMDRDGKRAWSGEGATAGESATKAVRSFISHRTAREYLPK